MYKLTNLGSITRLADGASVPVAPGNIDYEAFMRWLALGNVPLPIDPKTKVQELTELDQANKITQRELRDFMIAVAGATKRGIPTNLDNHPAVRKAATAEAEAEVIRGRP